MVYINAISTHLPEETLSNQAIIDDYLPYAGQGQKILSASDLKQQCWVENRHRVHPRDTAKDLGNAAAEKLFSEWKIDRKQVDYIIFVSDALDYKGPTTACIIQNDIGLKNEVGAIDILHGCTGFIYGLSIAQALLIAGQVENVLLITADIPTKVIHPEDAHLRAIFGDGAAATFLSKSPVEGGLNAAVGKFIFGTDGSGEDCLKTEHSASRNPPTIEWLRQFKGSGGLENRAGRLVMNSSAIFLFAVRRVPRLIKAVLEKNGLAQEDLSLYIPHQANGQMLNFLRKRMKISEEDFVINFQEVGNTVSASIPIALYKAYKNGRIKNTDKVLLAGFGIGLSWGGTVINFE